MSIKELRKSKGYSQKDISDILGMPLRTYKRYELGDDGERTYKQSLLEMYIKNIPNKAVRKNINSEYIFIIGISPKSYALGLLFSLKNNVTFFDENIETVNEINKGIYADTCLDIVDFYNKNKVKIKAKNNLKNISFSDFIFIFENSEEKVEKILSEINEKNKESVVIICSQIPIESLKKNYKNLELIKLLIPVKEKEIVNDLENPLAIIIGTNRITLKAKRLALVIQNVTNNAAKVQFVSLKEADSIEKFSKRFSDIKKLLIDEISAYACQNEIDFSKFFEYIKILANGD